MIAPDLFSWRDEVEAADWVASAEAARLEAERAFRRAPHGEVRNRLQRLRDATSEALRAEIYLQRLRSQSGRS